MLDNLNFDTTSFTSTYSTLKEKYRFSKYELRERLAEANNCIAIGQSSCYADMVAVPRDYPDVVIKICSGSDAFIDYAHLCVTGVLTGKHHLKVYSEAELSPGVWLFVMERLDRPLKAREWEMTVERANGWRDLPKRGMYAGVCKSIREDLNKMDREMTERGMSFCSDLHKGNVMCRKDGTIVLLDPVC